MIFSNMCIHGYFPTASVHWPSDFTGGTFVLTTLAMFAASVFFFSERRRVPSRWRPSLLVAAIITLVSATNYVFMSLAWLSVHIRPLELRYLDWFLTVPLICLQFYLLLRGAGAQPGLAMIWRLVGASVWMLGFGFIGQVIDSDQTVIWGAVATLGYAAILLEVSLGEAALPMDARGYARIKSTYDLLFRFIFLGWAIYPLAYMTTRGNLLDRWHDSLPFPVLYNVGDALNKIGFGLVIWRLAKSKTVAEPGAQVG